MFNEREDAKYIDLFSELPLEISNYLSLFLDLSSIGRISAVNKLRREQFNEPLIRAKAEKLLKEVMNGNPQGVEKSLKYRSSENESIVLRKRQVEEENGREWKRVSALEFAAWAGDTEIVNMLLDALTDEEKIKALSQLEGVQKGTEHGPQMSGYDKLIESYDEYIASYDTWNWSEREYYWVHNVGNNQLMLPIVGLQWMCDKEPFGPLPSFYRSPERSCKLSDNSSLLPFSNSGLASRIALYKGDSSFLQPGGRAASLCPVLQNRASVHADVAAYRHLCQVRKTELTRIIDHLQKTYLKTVSQENCSRTF